MLHQTMGIFLLVGGFKSMLHFYTFFLSFGMIIRNFSNYLEDFKGDHPPKKTFLLEILGDFTNLFRAREVIYRWLGQIMTWVLGGSTLT